MSTIDITAPTMIAWSEPSPSSPAPAARRCAASGLDRSVRPSKLVGHAVDATRQYLKHQLQPSQKSLTQNIGHSQLQITDKQSSDWNVLADALRSSRQHLLEARKLLVMDDKMQGTERLDHYERHLSERLEAIKSARAAFGRLYGTLNDGQKKTADALLLPLISTF